MKRAIALPCILLLAYCGGSAAPSASYEEEGAYSGGGAEAPMADDDGAYGSDDAGGEATEAEMDVAPSMVREPGMQPEPYPPQNGGTTTVRRPGPGSDLYDELVQTSIDLDQATTLASVDCSSARDLRDRICDLSGRICEIADDNPDDDPTAERCRDGRARCRGAAQRVSQSCP